MVGPDGCGVGRGRRLGDPGLDAGWVGRRGRPVGGGGVGAPRLAQEAAVEDAAHVGLVAGPDDEQGDEEGRDVAEGDSNAGVVEGEPLRPLIDLRGHVPGGGGGLGAVESGVGLCGGGMGLGGGVVGGGGGLWVSLRRMRTVL